MPDRKADPPHSTPANPLAALIDSAIAVADHAGVRAWLEVMRDRGKRGEAESKPPETPTPDK